jgi:hypothetical protein
MTGAHDGASKRTLDRSIAIGGLVLLAMLLAASCSNGNDLDVASAPKTDRASSEVRVLNDCPELPCGGLLEPGRYRWTFAEPAIDFEIPSPGWSWLFSGGGNFRLFADPSPAHEGPYLSDGVYFLHDPTVASRDCEDSSEPGVGRSMDELVRWLRSAPGLSTTEPAPATVGGLEGVWLDIEIDPTWTRPCFWSGKLPAVPLVFNGSELGGYNWAIVPDVSMRWYILESDRGVVIVDIEDGPDDLAHAELLETAGSIVDSIGLSSAP